MSEENRSVTIVPWPGPEDGTATPPELVCPRYTDFNYWQDTGVRAMSLDGTMTPPGVGFEDIEGCLKFYTQTTCPDGAATELGTFVSPRRYATALDLHNRIVVMESWYVAGAPNLLPKGINYDPDNFGGAPLEHIWHTGTGGSDAAPPVGDYWIPWVNVYFYVGDANNPTSLRCYNNTGNAINVVIMGTITQVITV